MMATAAITITLDPDDKTMSQGYRVVLLDGGNEIKDYSAGGNPHDSRAAGTSPVATVEGWARSTAEEMFEEYFGRPPEDGDVLVEKE